MCFDAQTSLATIFYQYINFVIFVLFIIKREIKNGKLFFITIILIGLMQLLEYFI